MPDAIQRLHEQRKVLETLQELSGKLRETEAALSNRAAAALAQSLAIRQQLDSLPPEFLPRERQALLARVQTLDDRIDEALRKQVRGIFARQRTHTADALRKDYLEVGLKNPGLLKRLTDALVAATEALNQEETGATNSHVQAQQRWQAVYDACNGKQPALAAARKKAAAFLPFWQRLPLLWLAGGVLLFLGIVAIVLLAFLSRRDGKALAISSIEPSSAIEGSAELTLTIRGANFDNDTVLQWRDEANGLTIITPTLHTSDQLTTTVAASLLQRAGNVFIRLHNVGADRYSNEMTFVVAAPTPTPTSPATFTPTPPPTDTPTPTNTPTLTPTPIIGDLPCVLKLTVSGSGEAKLPIDMVTVGEPKSESVSWLFSVLPDNDKDCGEGHVDEITKRDYRFTPLDDEGWILERTSPTLRLKAVGRVKVELVQQWKVNALSEDQETGSLNFGLEYQIGAEEWKPVQGSDGKPVQITLTWGRIAVATATPTATPKPTRTPTPTPSWLNGTITLMEPKPGQTLYTDQSPTFKWKWEGPALQGKQRFHVQFTKSGTAEKSDCQAITSLKNEAQNVEASCQQSLAAGDYTWRVWIEDGAGKKISNESAEDNFVVREPTPTQEPTPS